MKTLYLECNMGAAGDMLMAALWEICPDREGFLTKMNSLGLVGVQIAAEDAEKCGIRGTHMRVTVHGEDEVSQDVDTARMEMHSYEEAPEDGRHHHEAEGGHHHHHDAEEDHHHHHDAEEGHHHHHHASMEDITQLIQTMPLSDKVKTDAQAVYTIIAEAESQVHGTPVSQIHFHEVGTLDAVADVVGVCLLMDMIGADHVIVSPVHVGCGFVRCMHGILPVPAPATALILNGIPTYGGKVQGELCTPTGAALLKHFANAFGDRPMMACHAIGYGMGQKDFERANCVRAFLGDSQGAREEIVKLECNLDDMTGEAVAFACEQLFANGARDVYTQSIGMKKSRPGILLSVICMPEMADKLAQIMMKHTTTLGIRRQDMSRYVLERTMEEKQTLYGTMHIKKASGMGISREKIEYEDLAAAARSHDLSLDEVRHFVENED